MRYSKKITKKEVNGKLVFVGVTFGFLILIAGSTLLAPPETMQGCATDTNQVIVCGCPNDSNFIRNKNIILVDATDPVPKPRINDIQKIVEGFVKNNSGIFEWALNGKKVDQTSVYVLNSELPVQMLPVASYCQLPPDSAMSLSNGGQKAISKIKNALSEAVSQSVGNIANKTASNTSEIVKAIAATTDTNFWKNGSTFVLISDLYENSSTCGFFDKINVPEFSKEAPGCKKIVDQIASKMNGKGTAVDICLIHSKPMKEGLKSFWDDLFLASSDAKPKYECSYEKIEERAKFLGQQL